MEAKETVLAHMKNVLDKDGSVFAMIDSGARGSYAQLGQVIGMKGLVASPSGDIIELPVKGNFKEGFGVLEFFISSHGTRKGLSDTALRTANAGYLTRRLVDVAQDVVVTEEDCGDKDGEVFTHENSKEVGQTLAERVWGRFVLADIIDGEGNVLLKKGEVVDEPTRRSIENAKGIREIHVRSVLQCKLPKGICVKCYGYNLCHNDVVKRGVAAGIIAAQSIGEPGTQLTMRTFHLGGVAGGGDITQGLPRVEELFEARNPKRKAILTEVEGKIEIEDADGKIITSPTGRKIFEGRRGQKIVKVHFEGVDEMEIKTLKSDDVKVEEGEEVKKGQVIVVKGKSGEEIKAPYGGVIKKDRRKLILSYQGKHTKEYIVPIGFNLYVAEGDTVEKGQALTEGSINLRELFELKGRDAVQRYILKEIQAIYASQGQRLNDKHVEIIVKQMFSRDYIEDPGQTDLLPGETVERSQLMKANMAATAAGEKEAIGR
ncbi:MAG: DNA-directed RNA polymerase subunit beta', partial [Candidatus Magasanikbacteria bacterium CG10_big_fil_rev_8_21_14_0_10_38_6]